jgi:hypothetical protein
MRRSGAGWLFRRNGSPMTGDPTRPEFPFPGFRVEKKTLEKQLEKGQGLGHSVLFNRFRS